MRLKKTIALMAACLFLMAPVQASAAGETAAQGEQRAALQSRVYLEEVRKAVEGDR